jgi:hypothetical protein
MIPSDAFFPGAEYLIMGMELPLSWLLHSSGLLLAEKKSFAYPELSFVLTPSSYFWMQNELFPLLILGFVFPLDATSDRGLVKPAALATCFIQAFSSKSFGRRLL